LELILPSEGANETIAAFLVQLGGTAVEERDGSFVTYLPPPPDLEAFLEKVRRELAEIPLTSDLELTWGWQPHEDWEALWKKGLGPRRITPRLTVAPSWVDYRPGEGEILLTMDPGMAFGTAEHATTRSCLRALTRYLVPGERIADVGSGSGILSIAAVLLGAGTVTALEMDEGSCDAARENLARNGIQKGVRVLNRTAVAGELLPEAPFDGILANIQSGTLLPLLPVFRESLVPRGWFAASGILVEEQHTFLDAATEGGWTLQEAEEEGEWWTGVLSPDSSPR